MSLPAGPEAAERPPDKPSGGQLETSGYADRLRRANVDTSPAVTAGLIINLGQIILHDDCIQRASLDALTATRALFSINNRCHIIKLSLEKVQT